MSVTLFPVRTKFSVTKCVFRRVSGLLNTHLATEGKMIQSSKNILFFLPITIIIAPADMSHILCIINNIREERQKVEFTSLSSGI